MAMGDKIMPIHIAIMKMVLVCFCLLPMTVSAGTMDTERQQEVLAQASSYFQQATETISDDFAAGQELYRKALFRFEQLSREGGVHNGKLFYNIGNIHFLLGDLGRAILNYRRAQQYIPSDENLQNNLNYALSKRQDQLEIKQQQKILN